MEGQTVREQKKQRRRLPGWVKTLLTVLITLVVSGGLWCALLFRVMLDAGCGEGWAALTCAVLGAVLYAAALLAQGLSVRVVFASFRRTRPARQ